MPWKVNQWGAFQWGQPSTPTCNPPPDTHISYCHGNNPLGKHPPCSPDLAPSDFHLFPDLKKHFAGAHFTTEDALISVCYEGYTDISKTRPSSSSRRALWHGSNTTLRSHQATYLLPACKTTYRKESFFPRTISEWNSLPPEAVTAPLVETFKSGI